MAAARSAPTVQMSEHLHARGAPSRTALASEQATAEQPPSSPRLPGGGHERTTHDPHPRTRPGDDQGSAQAVTAGNALSSGDRNKPARHDNDTRQKGCST